MHHSRPALASRWLLAALFVVAWASTGSRADQPDEPETSAREVGGRVAWLSGDGLDLIGDVWADVPFYSRAEHAFYLSAALRTTIAGTSGLDLAVRDLQYRADLGWRLTTGDGPGVVSVFLGQRGRELVDQPGGARAFYLAAGLESRNRHRAVASRTGLAFQWSFALGPVLQDSGVDAAAYLRGDARLRYGLKGGDGPFRAIVFEFKADALAGGGNLDGDWTFGPGFEWPMGERHRATLFAQYQRSDNPLGLQQDSWLVGLELVEGAPTDFPATTDQGGADLSGSLGVGAGDDSRVAGLFELRFDSPQFGRRLRAIFDVDANLVTGPTDDELYWRYDIGIERVRRRTTVGAYLYHRSNHRLAQTGNGFTSINVVEVGYQTLDWNRPGHRGKRHYFEYRVRLGYLINSDFGEDDDWNLRLGGRWGLPFRFAGGLPYLEFELDRGDVNAERWAIGLSPARNLDIALEVREDGQWYGADQTATLLSARYGF